MIYIGPAGENRVRKATVMSKIAHAAGYGGYGGVMGSKNLKAIVAKGRGPLPDVAAPKTVEILMRDCHRSLISADPDAAVGYRLHGLPLRRGNELRAGEELAGGMA